MNKLRYNKFLILVLTLAVLVGTATSILLQKASQTNFSSLSLFLILPFTLLSQIGIIAIIWEISTRWPKVGGLVMLLLFGLFAFSAIPAYFGNWDFSNDNPAILVMFIVLAVLYVAAGIMLLLSKKVAKSEVPP